MSDNNDDVFDFPCEFPIKAIGFSSETLDATVYSIVQRHIPALGEAAVNSKPSSQGKYTSVTVTITATSREQLDAIYNDLSANEHIKIVL